MCPEGSWLQAKESTLKSSSKKNEFCNVYYIVTEFLLGPAITAWRVCRQK